MGAKIRDFLDALDYEELSKLKEDLERGGMALSCLVNAKIEQRRIEHGKFCANCFSEIDPVRTKSYTIMFGPPDLRQKASFCAMDCLEYFIRRLKQG